MQIVRKANPTKHCCFEVQPWLVVERFKSKLSFATAQCSADWMWLFLALGLASAFGLQNGVGRTPAMGTMWADEAASGETHHSLHNTKSHAEQHSTTQQRP
jgi:hypothetical protein